MLVDEGQEGGGAPLDLAASGTLSGPLGSSRESCVWSCGSDYRAVQVRHASAASSVVQLDSCQPIRYGASAGVGRRAIDT